MPLRFIRSGKAIRDAVLGLLPREAVDLFVANFGALLVDGVVATRVHFFDVVPEHLSIGAWSVRLLVNAHLSEVLQHNFFALNQLIAIFSGAVLSSPEAIVVHELFIAINAHPKHKPWRHQRIIPQDLVQLHEVLNEIKRQIIARRIPEVILNPVVWAGHIEIY